MVDHSAMAMGIVKEHRRADAGIMMQNSGVVVVVSAAMRHLPERCQMGWLC
jgi:hypothetical protein